MFTRLSTSGAPPPVPDLSAPSPPPSPKMALSFAAVAKIFLALRPRRHLCSESEEDNRCSALPQPPLSPATTASTTDYPFAPSALRPTITPPSCSKRNPSENTTSSASASGGVPFPSSPGSPCPKHGTYRTHLSSGDSPLSHPGIAEASCERREPVERMDTYLCTGGVNLPVLLRTTRTDLMDTTSVLGANALIEEQWKCSIYGPKNRSKMTYKVQIHYKAQATRSTLADPHQPVALHQTHSIPGLMTVQRLNDD